MEYIENDFAQIEHVNQVIANNLKHESWDCFDTYELLKQCPELGIFKENNRQQTKLVIPNNVKNIYGETVKKHSFIRYNYLIVSIEKGTTTENKKTVEYFRYTFEVRNKLWDGTYKITKSYPNSKGEYESIPTNKYTVTQRDEDSNVSAENLNAIVVTVFGDDRDKLRVCFHMNMTGSGRNILFTALPLVLESKDDFTHQYDTENIEKAKVTLSNGQEGKDVTVELIPCDEGGRAMEYDKDNPELIGPCIPPQKYENVKKEFDVTYGKTSVPGDYYCKMSATSTDKNTKPSPEKLIHVKKVQNEKAQIDWGDEENYKKIWKGCKHKYHISFNLQNEMGGQGDAKKLLDVPVTVTFIHTGGERIVHDSTIQKDPDKDEYFIEVTISYRKYYDDYSRLEVELDSKYGFGRILSEKLIKHPWYIAENTNDIISQLYVTDANGNYLDHNGEIINYDDANKSKVTNDYGTDWIFLRNRVYDITKTIEIDRELTIASLNDKDNAFSTLNGNNHNIIKTVNKDPSSTNLTKVNLIGLRFIDGECAINSSAGTRLLVDRCIFTQNHHDSKHHKGSSIYIAHTDYNVKHPELWKTEIRNSHFENNKGNEIQSIGTTRIIYNKFITTQVKYLQQPEVKVVNAIAGTVHYAYNISYINTGRNVMASNHCYAKALAYVHYGAKFNGASPNSLRGNMTLPLYRDYHNQAYTYTVYYYPHGNVRTNIVCSPQYGYERKATGHSSSAENWVYYDGYYFLRWEGGRNKGNTYDPWTKEELAVNTKMGIFNTKSEKFVDDYDPRFSNAKCNTSYFD